MISSDNNIIEKIYKSSLRFLTPLTPEETYAIIIQEILKLVEGDFGSLVLIRDEKLVKVYSSSPTGFGIKFRKKGFTYQAFKQKIILVRNINEIKHSHADLKKMGIKWALFIPLYFQKQALGAISINSSQEKRPNKKILRGLELFGSMASLAIHKSHVHQEIKTALELRDSFIAIAAHELRTPATSICGYAQLLEKRISSFNSQEGKWIKELRFESSRLSMLLKDLMEISRIRRNKMVLDLKVCSLKDIIKKTINDFNINFPTRHLYFNDKLDQKKDLIVADANKLIQVFINLLDNAQKFSEKTTQIVLTLDYKKPYLTVVIKDQGQGIAPHELPKIFNHFYQGQNSTLEGMGLGLFLSKNLIEKHQGDILIRSKLNKGTTVIVALPRATVNK